MRYREIVEADTSVREPTITVGNQRLAANGQPLPPHIAALRIPPAWTNVTYSPDPNAVLLVTGTDSKGRRQYIYSGAHSAKQAAAKFARIKELDRKYKSILAHNEKARQSNESVDVADAAALVMATGIRPGSETDRLGNVKAYGATTLEGQHVVPTENGVMLKFIGKKGVPLSIPVTDPDLVAMLLRRKRMAGDTGRLFPITARQLLDHVGQFGGGGFKTKDLRTLMGTRTAMEEVAKLPRPKNEKEYKKSVMTVAKTVATKLGNTPVIALQSYISPAVFAGWRQAAGV
jgi:DNA topoisomerase-1